MTDEDGKMTETLKEFIGRLQSGRLQSSGDSSNIPDKLVEELARWEREGTTSKILESLARLCYHFDDAGKWNHLLDTSSQGITISQEAENALAEAEFQGQWGLARIMQRSGEVQQGLQACRRSLELAQRVGSANSKRVQGLAHHFLGIGLSGNLERFADAIGHFRSGADLFQAIGDKNEEARLYFSQAWTMRSFGDFDEALDLVTRALSLELDCSDSFRATCLGFKADLERMSGQLSQAQECYEECAKLCRKNGDVYHLSAALASLGKVCVKQDKLEDAGPYLEEAFKMAQQSQRRSSGIADIMRSMAALACLCSEKEKMQHWHQEALKLSGGKEAASRPGKGQMQSLLRDMGLAYERLGDLDAALVKLKEAEEVFEKDWSIQLDDGLRCSFREIEPAKDLGPALQRLFLAKGLPLQALAKAESFRARALSARLMERNGKAFQGLPENNVEILQWLQRNVSKFHGAVLYYSITNDAHDLFPSSAGQLCTWVLGPDGNLRDWCLQDVAQVLPAEQDLDVFVRYARGCVDASRGDEEDRTASSQWSQNTFGEKMSNGFQPDARGGVRAWRRDRKALKDCYNLLIAPVLQHIKDESHLIIIPDGSLWMVPFAVLMAPSGHCLIQDFAVQLAPSLTALAEAQDLLLSEPESTRKALVISDPQVDDSLKSLFPETAAPLPESKIEGDMVTKKCMAHGMQVDHLVGAAAEKTNALSSLTEATTLVHFATHGILQRTGGSALALSGGEGLMNSQDLQGCHLKARAVILSSCNTGRGKLHAEGVLGLPRSFIAAGVPSVVMTLWKVGDCATRHVMDTFYREWFENDQDTASALRAAMLEVAQKPGGEFHLEHWAAFALVGCSYRVKDVMPRAMT